MKTFFVQIGEQEYTVSVDEGKVVAVNGTPVDAAVVQTSERHQFAVMSQGGIVPLVAARTSDGYEVLSRGVRLTVSVRSEREKMRVRFTHAAATSGTVEVRAPMPALVTRIEVRQGETVEAGRTLIVLEAMKMENDVRSPRAGTVGEVHVSAGGAVEKDQLLLTLT